MEFNTFVITIPNSQATFSPYFCQKIKTLGQAGNSANSREPHLYYRLQTIANPFSGEGLPAMFLNYFADDVLIKKGEPVKIKV